MKKSDLKEKSSVFYVGRGIIIISVVLTSSLGFVLGFIVGKNTAPNPAERAIVAPPPPVQKNVATEAKDPALQDPQQQTPVQMPETQKSPAKPAEQKTAEKKEIAEVTKPARPQETKQKTVVQEKESAKVTPPQETAGRQDAPDTSKKTKFTVQLGAFKSKKEADSFKIKFAKKGYKTTVLAAKDKKHEKLYKVLVGEFASRKEAELLSTRIKKTEGLSPFVTQKAG